MFMRGSKMAKAKVLTKEEIKRVMRIADTGKNGLRDRVALSLSIMAGMRIGSIAALKISDVRGIDGKAVAVINLSKHQTKGNRAQRVFISDELRKILNQYLTQISKLDDSKAFIRSSRTLGHFSNVSLSLRFKAIYAQAGIRTSSHSGRRTFATRLNAAGIGMATIQQAMGHANIATTAGYCWVSDEQLANAVNVI
jgi:integrase/recombinase XerD